MRAVVYDSPFTLEVREVPTPEPGPGEVRVAVLQTGFCGTDLHLHAGGFMGAYPLIPGHETVGVVDALGEGVTGFTVGEQVTINPNASCGLCPYCREGRPLLCDDLRAKGVNRPGMFAEYTVAPARQVFSVDGLDPDVAVFTEPTSCVSHGVERLSPAPNSTALVLGAGPTGILLAQLLATNGAAHVTIADRAAFKLDTAGRLGIDATYLMGRDDLATDVDRLRAGSGADGFDLVVDATGVPALVEQCVPLARKGGTVALYGVADHDARVTINPYDVFQREITIKGSFAEIHSFPSAIAALRARRVRTDGIITHRYGLEDYEKALRAIAHDPGVHKIVIDPRG